MIIDINKLPVKTMVNFNGGEKELVANMFVDDLGNKSRGGYGHSGRN